MTRVVHGGVVSCQVTRLTQKFPNLGRMLMKYFSLQTLLDRLFEDGWCIDLVPDIAPVPESLEDDLLGLPGRCSKPCET